MQEAIYGKSKARPSAPDTLWALGNRLEAEGCDGVVRMKRGPRSGPKRMPSVVSERGPDHDAMRRACADFFGSDFRAMAAAVKVHPTTAHGWLTGRNACGTPELELVARAAGVSLERIRYPTDVVIVNGQRLSADDAARVRRFVVDLLEGKGSLSTERDEATR